MNPQSEQWEEMLRGVTAQGADIEQIRKTASTNPKVAELLQKLSADDVAKINGILRDPAAASRILATAQAQALLKQFKSKP